MQSLWMVVAAVFYAVYGVCIKFASLEGIGAWEVLFYRSFFGLVVFFIMMHREGTSMRTQHPWAHAVRSLAGVAAIVAGIYSLSHLNLGRAGLEVEGGELDLLLGAGEAGAAEVEVRDGLEQLGAVARGQGGQQVAADGEVDLRPRVGVDEGVGGLAHAVVEEAQADVGQLAAVAVGEQAVLGVDRDDEAAADRLPQRGADVAARLAGA